MRRIFLADIIDGVEDGIYRTKDGLKAVWKRVNGDHRLEKQGIGVPYTDISFPTLWGGCAGVVAGIAMAPMGFLGLVTVFGGAVAGAMLPGLLIKNAKSLMLTSEFNRQQYLLEQKKTKTKSLPKPDKKDGFEYS